MSKSNEVDGNTAEQPEVLTRDSVAEMVNKAITAHGKRQEASLAKLISEQLASFGEQLKPKPEPEEKVSLKAELEQLKRAYERTEQARKAAEESARKERTHSQLKAALEGAGARKEAVDVLVAAWGASGVLRYDEAGNPQLAIKRARTKGAPAEELIHDDFAQGVADWSKSPEASVFLAPPSVPGMGQRPQQTAQHKQAGQYAAPPESEEEKARRTLEMLESAGLNALGQQG